MSTPKDKMKTMPTGILKNEAIFNEALVLMEALLYRGVITRAILDPAGISPDPVNGDTYFVPDGSPNSTGDWSGQGGSIAVYFDGWRFIPPADGLTVWIVDEAQSIQFRNGEWVELSEFAAVELNELNDVDFSGSPSPQDGEALVFDGASQTWKPGQSGAVAFTKVELTGNQAVSANNAVAWDQVRESHGDLMWFSGEPSRLVAVGRGLYSYGFHIDTTTTTSTIIIAVHKNGVDLTDVAVAEAAQHGEMGGTSGGRFSTLTGALILEQGEFLEAVLFFNGATLEANNNVSFWMLKVAAL